jgi:hypothetical protein
MEYRVDEIASIAERLSVSPDLLGAIAAKSSAE